MMKLDRWEKHLTGWFYQISDLMKQVAQEERDKRIAEMAFLQAQINPHFVSNVLNNVAWMAKFSMQTILYH